MSILQKGDSGIEVANSQRFLVSLGYDLDADGEFGERTAKATRAIQAAQGLRADGIVGDMTFKAVQAAAPKNIGSVKTNPSPILDINEKRLAKVHPVLAGKARRIIALAQNDGFTLQVSQGLRTFEEQDALFAKGRTRLGDVVTNARGGQSYHNYGLAKIRELYK